MSLFLNDFIDTPRSRRLNTNAKSNILFYLTGHGGENFLKFQDDEEINAFELADAFEQMKQKNRYNELLFIGIELLIYHISYCNRIMYIVPSSSHFFITDFNEYLVDTCQAESMIRAPYSDGFVGFASSRVGEDSLSHHVDQELGKIIFLFASNYVSRSIHG